MTATSSLSFTRFVNDSTTASSGKSLSFGGLHKEQKLRVSEQKSMIHPSRSSSLGPSRSSSIEPPYAQPTITGQVVFENGHYNDRPAPSQDSTLPMAKNGIQELAGTRAQLVAVQRRVLEQVGKALGWSIGWAAILPSLVSHEELSDVDLENDTQDSQEAEIIEDKKPAGLGSPIAGILAVPLIDAMISLEQFRHFYEVCWSMTSVRYGS